MAVFEQFEIGALYIFEKEIDIGAINWSIHNKFEGVALKHLITAKDTEGEFSYHLVRVAPQKKIGLHVHETQLETHEVIAGAGACITGGRRLAYTAGVIAVLPAGVEHEVLAGADGLYLFAKFFPALF